MLVASMTVVSCNEYEFPTVHLDNGFTPLELGKQPSKPLNPAQFTRSQQEISTRHNSFAFDFFKAVAEQNVNNIAISPYSVFTNLSMIAAGAKDTTYMELVSALDLEGCTQEEVADYCRMMTGELKELDNNVVFESANAFWYNPKENTPKSDYVELLTTSFNSEVSEIEGNDVDSRFINWAKEKSHGLIQDALKGRVLRQKDWFLANVTYYQGIWKDTTYIRENSGFTTLSGKLVAKECFRPKQNPNSVELPHLLGFNLGEEADASKPSGIWLPYGNEGFSFAVILPPVGQTLSDFVSTLSPEKYKEFTDSRELYQIFFRIPMFQNEYSLEYESLVPIFNSMGIRKLFYSPDLSGMMEGGTAFNEMLFNTKLFVSDKGTQAAGSIFDGRGGGLEDRVEFIANRPFVYAIMDVHGTMLYMGTVTE